MNTWEKRCPERRNSKFKDPEVGAGLVGSWNSGEAHGRIVEREPEVKGGFKEPLSTELHVVILVKKLPANTGDIRDVGSIPGLEGCLAGGHGNPVQYSCLENLMDRGAWQATVDGVTKSHTWLEQLSTQNIGVPMPKTFNGLKLLEEYISDSLTQNSKSCSTWTFQNIYSHFFTLLSSSLCLHSPFSQTYLCTFRALGGYPRTLLTYQRKFHP